MAGAVAGSSDEGDAGEVGDGSSGSEIIGPGDLVQGTSTLLNHHTVNSHNLNQDFDNSKIVACRDTDLIAV